MNEASRQQVEVVERVEKANADPQKRSGEPEEQAQLLVRVGDFVTSLDANLLVDTLNQVAKGGAVRQLGLYRRNLRLLVALLALVTSYFVLVLLQLVTLLEYLTNLHQYQI